MDTDVIAMDSLFKRSGNPSEVDVRFTPQFLNNVVLLIGKCILSGSANEILCFSP